MGVGGVGWVVLMKTKANLAQFQMKLPAGAKLGNSSIPQVKVVLLSDLT